jgi:adenylate cyclase
LERKLTAILCADVHGYSRLMGEDEEATLRTLTVHRKVIDSSIEQHRGRFVSSAGDSVLAEFASVVEAMNCAVDIQTALKAANANLPPERRMEFRIGVNLGDVMMEGEQIYGDGVNVAARLESLAEPGGICVSSTVRDHIKNKLTLTCEDLGEKTVKNIAEPVHVWRVLLDGAPLAGRQPRLLRRKYWREGVLSVTGLTLIVGTILLVQHLSFKPPRTSASIPSQEKPALPVPSIPSIAVLPFTNLSGDPGQEYFSDGLTDNLITKLSRLPGVFVIGRNSSFSYKGKAISVQRVGWELGVRTILEGSVLKTANRVRINAQLADATNGVNLWAQGFDQPLKDIFAMQDDIVRDIVTTLGLFFKLDTLNHWRGLVPEDKATENMEAFDDLLRGAERFWRFTKEGNEKSREMYRKAVALDPKYAEAYAAVGWTFAMDVAHGWSRDPKADLERAFALAQDALALDDSNLLALSLVSQVDSLQQRFDQAVKDAERVIDANPNFSWGYFWLALALNGEGRPQDAIPSAQKAIRLDPALQDVYGSQLGVAYLNMGRYQQAVPFIEHYLGIGGGRNDWFGHLALSIAYTELGRDQDAQAQAAEAMRLNPHYTLPSPDKWLWKNSVFARRQYADLRKAGLR